MGASLVLPLYPLENSVLLPGEHVTVPAASFWARTVFDRAEAFGDTVAASLADGSSVHEVGVTALVEQRDKSEAKLRGIDRCRLLSLESEEPPLVRVERFSEAHVPDARETRVGRLLLARYTRLQEALGNRVSAVMHDRGLSTLTWRVAATLGLSADQQQGFLNVPDSFTRGRMLLVAVRELERRARFLKPWAHLRTTTPWN